MKKAKPGKCEGDGAELSEGGEEQGSANEAFKDEEEDGETDRDEECDGPELPSGLTGKEASLCVCMVFVCMILCYSKVCVCLPPPPLFIYLFLSGAFEDQSFASLAELVSENTLKGIKEIGFENMTEIQHKTIRPLLEGR